MRNLILLGLGLFLSTILNSQTSLASIALEYGSYQVGFQHYTQVDSSRMYRIHNEKNRQWSYRPIPISIWYPADVKNNSQVTMTVLDYLQILKEEEEWEHLPNEFLLDWFTYLWNTPANQAHLTEKALAVKDAPWLGESFPVVVYAPSYQASSMENFALCEYLASQGYVVIASPSRGTDTRWLEGGTVKDMETQSRDVEFLLREIHRYLSINTEQIALMGFSFGGLSNALTVMKQPQVKAVVSLDGTERYRHEVLASSAYYNLARFDRPYVHFAQKEIPQDILKRENLPPSINTEFALYDSLSHSDIYRYRFHDLTHGYFSSFGVLFSNRDPSQDKSDDKIMASYRLVCEHVLQFLQGQLQGGAQALAFMEQSPAQNGYAETLLTQQKKKAQTPPFDYRTFIDLAYQQDYADLIPLYTKVKREHPDLALEEGMLNILGLYLSFDPATYAQGVQIFELATHLYPNSSNLYDSLGEAHLHQKEYAKAKEAFRQSLRLNPENGNATRRLEEMGE
ncbi:MAG: tetratricopeptide repeat protein [Bacteroidota bacterium]